MEMTDIRREASSLAGTYWYCAAETVPAIRTQGKDSLGAVADQTVWYATGARHRYFWGVGSALVTAEGETPEVDDKSDFTFYGSVTPSGSVHITFLLATGSTIGTGTIVDHRGEAAFEMQMSSGPARPWSCTGPTWSRSNLETRPGSTYPAPAASRSRTWWGR